MKLLNWVENYQIKNKLWNIEPSFFELTVAMAFDYFAKKKLILQLLKLDWVGDWIQPILLLRKLV